MADVSDELNARFAPPNATLDPEVIAELKSLMSLHSYNLDDVWVKWESYNLKLGSDALNMSVKTVRDFKKDIGDTLDRETRSRVARGSDKKAVGATPRVPKQGACGDVFDILDGLTPTPKVNGGTGQKRGNTFETPAAKASKLNANSSPANGRSATGSSNANTAAFSERANAGKVDETLNDHITAPTPPPVPFPEPRIKLKAISDLLKANYKTGAMKLNSASEILDDRIDEFLSIIQAHYQLEDSAFGNPAAQSPDEIVAVGRIACDTTEAKLNPASIVLETSRRSGSGLRVPLKLDSVTSYDVFPGKIIAVKGTNPSGESFTVSEILEMPLLPPAASTPADLQMVGNRLLGGAEGSDDPIPPLNVIIAAGPYTADSNLDFEPLHALMERALSTSADSLILLGPFLDTEHPLIASGAIPQLPNVEPDSATMLDVFRALISAPLQQLAQQLPSLTIVMVPSVRDAASKHIAWPQERIARKSLGLPKQTTVVTNPATLSVNEMVVAMSSQDILYELRREECIAGSQPEAKQNMLARLSKDIIEQRHFFPLFPATNREFLPKPTLPEGYTNTGDDVDDRKATGAALDISYLSLADWQKVRPDILITPSSLAPFAKIVDDVVVVNPGNLSKKRGPGTFAQFYVNALKLDLENEDDGDLIGNRVYERARVDVVKI